MFIFDHKDILKHFGESRRHLEIIGHFFGERLFGISESNKHQLDLLVAFWDICGPKFVTKVCRCLGRQPARIRETFAVCRSLQPHRIYLERNVQHGMYVGAFGISVSGFVSNV
jgi:hypothetical protein